MKMFVAGVKILGGNSKKTGEKFSMPRVFGLVAVEAVKNKSITIEGFGFEPMELDLDPESLPQFAGFKFPCVLDLETDVAPSMGELKTVVIGVRTPTPAVKAA